MTHLASEDPTLTPEQYQSMMMGMTLAPSATMQNGPIANVTSYLYLRSSSRDHVSYEELILHWQVLLFRI